MQTLQIRRRTNGTIDIDSYRQEALMLRAQSKVQFFRGTGRKAWPLIGAVAIIVAYAVFLPRNPMPPTATSMLVSANVSLLAD